MLSQKTYTQICSMRGVELGESRPVVFDGRQERSRFFGKFCSEFYTTYSSKIVHVQCFRKSMNFAEAAVSCSAMTGSQFHWVIRRLCRIFSLFILIVLMLWSFISSALHCLTTIIIIIIIVIIIIIIIIYYN